MNKEQIKIVTKGLWFFAYLISIPLLISLMVPCMRVLSGSYEFLDCNIILVMDRYIQLSVVGLAVAVFLLLFKQRKHIRLRIGLIIVMITAIVAGYYLYMPVAYRHTSVQKVFLDTMYKNQSVLPR